MPRYFESFVIGEEMVSAEKVISATDITTFATLSGDHNPLHLDDDYAQASIYGGRIAHGLLVQAIASGLLLNSGMLDGSAVGLRHIDCKLRAAVFVNDRIYVHATVAAKKVIRRLGVGNISVAFRVINQEAITVQKGTWQLLVKLQPE